MIFTGTRLPVGDNSGALLVQCIKIMSKSKYRWGSLADVALVSVKRVRPAKRVKKKEKHRFLIVNTKLGVLRYSELLRFATNSGVVLKKEDAVPIASRVSLIAPFELRRNFRRIVTMASVNV